VGFAAERRSRFAGDPGELLLYLSGRKAAAQVEVSGSEAAVEAAERADHYTAGAAGAAVVTVGVHFPR
jgi:hypothetical protein